MSYTLTIDEPRAAKWLEQEQTRMAPGELGLLFVAFLAQRRGLNGKTAQTKPLRRRAKRMTLPPLTRRLGGLLKPEKPLPPNWDYHDVLDECVRNPKHFASEDIAILAPSEFKC